MTEIRLDAVTAHGLLTDHPRYRYRGCAPDVDNPRMAAGGSGVSVDAWQAPDLDGGESREVREAREAAAVDVCVGCPVMVQCMAFGASLTPDGKLAEPFSVLGGMTPLERHKAFVAYKKQLAEMEAARPQPAPVEQLRTKQKLAVLRALARFSDPADVAVAAGMDLRTAKWQIARLTTQLGVEKSAGRAGLLQAAVERGLLEPSEVRQARPLPVGQLSFDDVLPEPPDDGPVPVSSSSAAGAVSFISSRKRLEAAA
ncbi:helix-turn-helix transcriptional regulator [Streptomyces albogriseolus]